MQRFSHITSRCFVNAPFDRLMADLLPLFLEHRVQPEIGLEGGVLYAFRDKDFSSVARRLHDAGLGCTLHAPFLDLVPGALDRRIRQATRDNLKKAFDLLDIFHPVSIVCHLGYEVNKHGWKQEEWFANAVEIWSEMLAISTTRETPMMLENTFENNPAMHLRIFEQLASPYARFCLDVGHVMAFARNTWQDWLPALAPHLGQLHLHDNSGAGDDHLAIGKGVFDFAGLFAYLKKNHLQPIITLEPHHENGLWDSLEALDSFDYFPRLPEGQS